MCAHVGHLEVVVGERGLLETLIFVVEGERNGCVPIVVLVIRRAFALRDRRAVLQRVVLEIVAVVSEE